MCQRRSIDQQSYDSDLSLLAKNIDCSYLFQKARTTNLRGHSLKLYKKRSRLDVRKHVLSQRIVDYWNRLPDDTVTVATTLKQTR